MKTDKKTKSPEMKQHLELLDAKQATLALQNSHAAELKKLGSEIIESIAIAGEKYLNICKFIRNNQVAPKLVSFELSALGMHRNVISKINKVANLPDEQWNQFAARTIGFNKVIELKSPGAAAALAESTGQTETSVKAQLEEMEQVEQENPEFIEKTPEQKREAAEKLMAQGAAKVLSAAASLELKREKKINGGNGYILTISKDKKWVAPTGQPAAPEETKK